MSKPWSTRVGIALYYRGKGAPWVEMFRPWIVPMVFSGAGAKYLGLSTGLAIGLAIAIPLTIEVLAVVLGLMEHQSGATEAHYRVATETDVYKRESLRFQAQHLAALQDLKGEVRRLGAMLERLGDGARQ